MREATIKIRLRDEDRQAIQEIAAREDSNLSVVIRRAIRLLVAETNGKPS